MTKARSCRRIRNFKVRQVRCISLAAEVSYLGTIIERGWEPYASVLLELGNMSACIIWCTINFSWQIGVSHLHLTTLLNYALAKSLLAWTEISVLFWENPLPLCPLTEFIWDKKQSHCILFYRLGGRRQKRIKSKSRNVHQSLQM